VIGSVYNNKSPKADKCCGEKNLVQSVESPGTSSWYPYPGRVSASGLHSSFEMWLGNVVGIGITKSDLEAVFRTKVP